MAYIDRFTGNTTSRTRGLYRLVHEFIAFRFIDTPATCVRAIYQLDISAILVIESIALIRISKLITECRLVLPFIGQQNLGGFDGVITFKSFSTL